MFVLYYYYYNINRNKVKCQRRGSVSNEVMGDMPKEYRVSRNDLKRQILRDIRNIGGIDSIACNCPYGVRKYVGDKEGIERE